MINIIERQNEVLNLIGKNGSVLVPHLAQLFEVSSVTIRSDLNQLSMKRLITRCRGGAIASTVLTRAISNHDYDMQISSVDEIFALSAIKLIENGDVVYLDPNMSSKNLAMCFSELFL